MREKVGERALPLRLIGVLPCWLISLPSVIRAEIRDLLIVHNPSFLSIEIAMLADGVISLPASNYVLRV